MSKQDSREKFIFNPDSKNCIEDSTFKKVNDQHDFKKTKEKVQLNENEEKRLSYYVDSTSNVNQIQIWSI